MKNPFLMEMFDVTSVTSIVSGAAPFDKNLADMVLQLKPHWKILPGYGKDFLSFCGSSQYVDQWAHTTK
jgi:hypothetical protein